jgi:hypothetical protein
MVDLDLALEEAAGGAETKLRVSKAVVAVLVDNRYHSWVALEEEKVRSFRMQTLRLLVTEQ